MVGAWFGNRLVGSGPMHLPIFGATLGVLFPVAGCGYDNAAPNPPAPPAAPAPEGIWTVSGSPSARSGHTLFWSMAFWTKPAGLPLN